MSTAARIRKYRERQKLRGRCRQCPRDRYVDPETGEKRAMCKEHLDADAERKKS